MLDEDYHTVPVNVQHRYVRCTLSHFTCKSAATVCLAASCLLQSVHFKTVFTTFPFHFVALYCILGFILCLKLAFKSYYVLYIILIRNLLKVVSLFCRYILLRVMASSFSSSVDHTRVTVLG